MRAQAIITCTGFCVTHRSILNMNMMIILSIKLEMEDGRGLYELCISLRTCYALNVTSFIQDVHILELEHPIGMKELLAHGRNRIGEMG